MGDIDVLVVEDDPMVTEICRRYIDSLEGFRVIGTASNGRKAIDMIGLIEADLLILDIFMPDLDGLATLRALRGTGCNLDVIVVSAAHDVETLAEAIQGGVFDYIVKPFNFERLGASLVTYRQMRLQFESIDRRLTQEDVDGLLRLRNRKNLVTLPKGLNRGTLDKVIAHLKQSSSSLSADETADALGVSRVTARRYLEHLVVSGRALVERSYREVGRPLHRYRLTE